MNVKFKKKPSTMWCPIWKPRIFVVIEDDNNSNITGSILVVTATLSIFLTHEKFNHFKHCILENFRISNQFPVPFLPVRRPHIIHHLMLRTEHNTKCWKLVLYCTALSRYFSHFHWWKNQFIIDCVLLGILDDGQRSFMSNQHSPQLHVHWF